MGRAVATIRGGPAISVLRPKALPLDYYLGRIIRGEHFAVAGYSDAEWFSILGIREGERTALGQTITARQGARLRRVLIARASDPDFIFAMPNAVFNGRIPALPDGRVERWLSGWSLKPTIHERDRITDDLAASAGLFPLIDLLRRTSCVLVGPRELEGICDWLQPRVFYPISSPNFHLEANGIKRAVDYLLRNRRFDRPDTYLFSAGVSAAVLIDALYDSLPDSQFLDCGSIWDAFVGIGGQREWRAKLYADPEAWERWKRKNLTGAD